MARSPDNLVPSDGGQLPADIPVGTIVSIDAKGVLVRPLADIDKVTYVQVINTGTDAALIAEQLSPQTP